jgi:hypothetical protein
MSRLTDQQLDDLFDECYGGLWMRGHERRTSKFAFKKAIRFYEKKYAEREKEKFDELMDEMYNDYKNRQAVEMEQAKYEVRSAPEEDGNAE